MDTINTHDKVEEDIFLFVSILLGPVSPLCLASPVASALFLLVPSSAEPPIPPLSSAVNTKRQRQGILKFLFRIFGQTGLN